MPPWFLRMNRTPVIGLADRIGDFIKQGILTMEAIQGNDHNQENILLNFFCFRNILETAVRYWKLACVCAVIGVAVAFVATKWFIKPVFVTQSTIYSGKENSDESNDTVNAAYRELTVAMMLMNDYKAIIDSNVVRDTLAGKVMNEFPQMIKAMEVENAKALQNFVPDERKTIPELPFNISKQAMEQALAPNAKNLGYAINIEIRRDCRVLTITARAGSPELAQYVADETASIFSDKIRDILKMDNVKIIDRAKKPLGSSNLRMRFNMTVGLFIGLVVGVGLAILRGFIDQTIKNPEQAKRYLNIPVMGVVPKCDMPESRSNLISNILDGSGQSELTEAYRLLRTNLQYFVSARSGADGEGRVFMFTSSIPHEGKSSSISLVSALTARAGKKVLLIDADMHKPVQSRIFNLRSGVGFVSVLTGDKTVDEAVQHVEDCLDVMPCGPIPPNPSELLMSERMPQLLDELRQKYDYVFIDITPALFLSDPLIVKPMVDGVLFMVACSQTKIGMIQRTVRQLQQVSKTPIGLVVNQFDRGEVGNRYGYYGYYRYHSYYRYYREYSNEENGDGKAGEAKKDDAPKKA